TGMTVILNLASMSVTGILILQHVRGIGPPPLIAALWLLLAMIPLVVFFGSLCLALSAFARSTAEGHYYMMPLFMVMMPLMFMPLLPDVKINLGYSLIPVAGVVLLLRTLIEGDYAQAVPYVFPVAAVTIACGWLSLRWAIEQFNSEAVLFREAEQVQPKLLLRSFLRNRGPTPSFNHAVAAAITVMYLNFAVSAAMPATSSLIIPLLVPQTVFLVAGLVGAMLLTTNARRTLLLNVPRWWTVPAAMLLAALLHPAVQWLGIAIQTVYQIPPEVMAELQAVEARLMALPLVQRLMLIALAPAVCEELVFRGFLLSGFRSQGREWRAIIITSVVFGMAHMMLQQSLNAMFVGVVLGFIAVKTGSLLVPMTYHFCHNSIALMKITPTTLTEQPWLSWLICPFSELQETPFAGEVLQGLPLPPEALVFRWQAVLLSVALSGLVLWAFSLTSPRDDGKDEIQDEPLDESNTQIPPG
ncbi:MAG: CPBP family glutamic-type intramembrane protease, partial [Planctomycetales bacterium]